MWVPIVQTLLWQLRTLHYAEALVERGERLVGTISAAELVAQAKSRTEELDPAQVKSEVDAGALLVDLRESEERVLNGSIASAIHAPRGMLEFYADPSSAYHRKEFDPESRVILHCASGGRSALAAESLKQLGYKNVAHLAGGITAWKEAGLSTE